MGNQGQSNSVAKPETTALSLRSLKLMGELMFLMYVIGRITMRQKFLAFIAVSTIFIPACLAEQNRAGNPPEPVNSAAQGSIEILRDKWDIPHVFSISDTGAMYGLGYVTAQDRAFQMFYNLRIIQGRLAEVLGDIAQINRKTTAIQNDKKMRTFGFYRAAQNMAKNLDFQTVTLLEAYCAGVNDYIKKNPDKLSPLFDKYDLKPEAWTPADCIVSWWHVGQFFGTDGTRELIAWRNQTGRGRPMPGRDSRSTQTRRPMGPPNIKPDDSVAVIQRTDVSQEWIDRVNAYMKSHGFNQQSEGRKKEAPETPKFSHAWVIGKKKTTTGSAILISDPQTPVNNPSLFYEYHIKGKTFNARGIGVPGSPIILIGFSDHVAWGATALGADQADLFRLKTSSDKPNQYNVDGRWKPMKIRQEIIKVKADKDQSITIRETEFGPVITQFAFAQDGTTVKNDWQGIVPHDLMPHVLNPESGVLFSANHRTIGSFYHVPIGNSTGSLDSQNDIDMPLLYCTDGNTILSQQSQGYTQFVPMHNPDLARTILPIGQSEIPGSAGFAHLRDDWAYGKLHPAPLTREAVDKIVKYRIVLNK
jgi:acyl-homoserine lactone acylase PvdQ